MKAFKNVLNSMRKTSSFKEFARQCGADVRVGGWARDGLRDPDGRQLHGRIMWQMSLDGEVRHSPSVARNRLGVVATLDGRLVGINLERRRIVWEQKLGGGAYGGPAISDGGVLIVTQEGVVSAWR